MKVSLTRHQINLILGALYQQVDRMPSRAPLQCEIINNIESLYEVWRTEEDEETVFVLTTECRS